MFFQMNMYYYDSKTKALITDKDQIKSGYMKSWFFIDLFSVMPVDQVLLALGNLLVSNCTGESCMKAGYSMLEYSQRARMFRLIRLVRLVRLAELLNID